MSKQRMKFPKWKFWTKLFFYEEIEYSSFHNALNVGAYFKWNISEKPS